MVRKFKDNFGFIIHDLNLRVGPYIIKPVRRHAALIQRISQYVCSDGFLYLPVAEMKCNTARPYAHFLCPPSHKVYLANNKQLPINFRQKDGALIIHLLGFLLECRAQFSDWFFDTRLPVKQDGIAIFNTSDLETLVNTVYSEFLSWSDDAQKRYINILYLHSRSRAYDDWEHFMMEYTITDAFWKLFKELPRYSLIAKSCKGHGDRMEILCKTLNVIYKPNEIKKIVEFRNELFHEALWDSMTPGFTTDGSEQIYALFNLRKLNQRLILAITGVQTMFTKSDWTSKSMESLL